MKKKRVDTNNGSFDERRSKLKLFFSIIILSLIFLFIGTSSANSLDHCLSHSSKPHSISVSLVEENTTLYLHDNHIEGLALITLINSKNETVNRTFIFRPGYFHVKGKVICNSKEIPTRGKGVGFFWDISFKPNEKKIVKIYFNASRPVEAFNLQHQGVDTKYYHNYVVPGLVPLSGQGWSQPIGKIKIRLVAVSEKYVFPEYVKTYDPRLHFPKVYWKDDYPIFEFSWNNLDPPDPISKQHYEHRKDAVWSYTPYYPIIEIKGDDAIPPYLSSGHFLLLFYLLILVILNKTGEASLYHEGNLEGFDIREFERSNFGEKTLIVLIVLMPMISISLFLFIFPKFIVPIGKALDRSWSLSSLQVINAVISAEGAPSIHFLNLVIPYLGIRVAGWFLLLLGGGVGGGVGLGLLLFKIGFIISAIKKNKIILLNYFATLKINLRGFFTALP